MPLLGIDVGTGGTRALVVADDGRVLATSTCDHAPFVSSQPGWAEQSPDDWWRPTLAAVRDAVAQSRIDAQTINRRRPHSLLFSLLQTR
jgi:xylulokinase